MVLLKSFLRVMAHERFHLGLRQRETKKEVRDTSSLWVLPIKSVPVLCFYCTKRKAASLLHEESNTMVLVRIHSSIPSHLLFCQLIHTQSHVLIVWVFYGVLPHPYSLPSVMEGILFVSCRSCYISVDFATAASQSGACIYQWQWKKCGICSCFTIAPR